MFEVAYNEFSILCHSEALPDLYLEYQKNSILNEEFDRENSFDGKWCFVGVKKGNGWPFLTVAQIYWPAGYGFNPGALLVPETSILFIGAGERLLAYSLREPKRLWADSTNTGFWHWKRHGDIVLMSAELEFAAWTINGVKLWSTFVEPPWTYAVQGEYLILDAMGRKTEFSVRHGPRASQ